jgi:uncharacterized membrane protein YedE/YeeE
MSHLVALLCGTIFGLGLTVSGMINPAKVLNFLDVAGPWDPTLAFVFVGALLVTLPAYQFAIRRASAPLLADEFELPGTTAITPTLVGGSALFGVGWGSSGFCPGPGLTSLATLLPATLLFVAGMFAGIAVYTFLIKD